MTKKSGFTLVEILVVVALVAILAAITIIAINPAKNFADTRNAQRSSDVGEILSAVTQYTSEQGNAIDDFGTITACADGADAIGTGADNIDLKAIVVTQEDIIVEVPMDPSGGTEADTGYTICLTSGGRVQIDAPNAENGKTISVKR